MLLYIIYNRNRLRSSQLDCGHLSFYLFNNFQMFPANPTQIRLEYFLKQLVYTTYCEQQRYFVILFSFKDYNGYNFIFLSRDIQFHNLNMKEEIHILFLKLS